MTQKIKAISQEEFEKIIKEKTNIKGEIKDIQFFSTWFNPNCAIVINKLAWYATRVVIYESEQKIEEEKGKVAKIPETLKVIKISERYNLSRAQIEAERIKSELNGNNPVLSLARENKFALYDAVKRFSLPLKVDLSNSEKYLREFDIVWRKAPTRVYHTAVYLGSNRVVHFSFETNMRSSRVKEENWKEFLKKIGMN